MSLANYDVERLLLVRISLPRVLCVFFLSPKTGNLCYIKFSSAAAHASKKLETVLQNTGAGLLHPSLTEKLIEVRTIPDPVPVLSFQRLRLPTLVLLLCYPGKLTCGRFLVNKINRFSVQI